MAAECIHSA